MARDPEGLPRIPATTLKGALRSSLERVIRGAHGSSSQPPDGDGQKEQSLEQPASLPEICHPDSSGGQTPCKLASCAVCGLFGNVGRAGILRFGDGRILTEGQQNLFSPQRRGGHQSEVKTGQPLERGRRTPGSHAQTHRESIGAGMQGLKFMARLETSRPLTNPEEALLQVAARSIQVLGGGARSGAGQVRVNLQGPLPVRDPIEHRTASDIRIILTAREPFRVARDRSSSTSFTRSIDYIPGATLRGALAAGVAEVFPEDASGTVFPLAFGADGIRVTDAIPSGRRVAPASLVTCDAFPGFHLLTGPKLSPTLWSHGAWDMLLVEFLAGRLSASRRWPWTGHCLLTLEDRPCPGRLVPFGRPYLTERTSEEQIAPFSSVLSYTAVDRVSGRAARDGHHAREVTLPTKGMSRYEAEVLGIPAALEPSLARLAQLKIGGSIATGNGLFSVRIEPCERLAVRPALEAVEEATSRLLAKWPGGAVTRTEVGLDRQRLAIVDLSSDWIPRRWLPTMEETVAFDLPRISGLEVLSSRLSVGNTGGFNTRAGLPKPYRRTFRRGGVVLIGFPLAHEAEVLEALEKLVRTGAGQLTEEGFGHVRVCDPVHWERIPPLTEGR